MLAHHTGRCQGCCAPDGRMSVAAVTVQVMDLCERCKQVRAAINKADVRNVAKKVASAAVVTCACGAIVEPPSTASAEAHSPALAEYSIMWPSTPSSLAFRALGQPTGRSPARPMFSPAGRGDSEPPNSDGPDQTLDGSAATYSGTASTFGVVSFSPQPGTLPDSGPVSTFPAARWTVRNWAPLAAGQGHAPVVADLPEHAPLQQLPPVIRVPAESRAVPASLRFDRSHGRNPGRRGS
jgi:hypothetical protein